MTLTVEVVVGGDRLVPLTSNVCAVSCDFVAGVVVVLYFRREMRKVGEKITNKSAFFANQ